MADRCGNKTCLDFDKTLNNCHYAHRDIKNKCANFQDVKAYIIKPDQYRIQVTGLYKIKGLTVFLNEGDLITLIR